MKEEWNNTSERFISFLDIMGFKDLVAREDHDNIKESLQNLTNLRRFMEASSQDLELVEGEMKLEATKENIRSVSFSDSIMFVSSNNSLDNYELIVESTSAMIATAIGNRTPIKGAIAHGLVTADFENQIFFGQPIIDAYLLQESLFYYGAVFHNSIEEHLKEINRSRFTDVKFLSTPLKTGLVKHYNIGYPETTREQIIELYKKVSGSPRKYVDNTLEMFDQFDND